MCDEPQFAETADERCGAPSPDGGPGCDLTIGHDSHARAHGGPCAWGSSRESLEQAVAAMYELADEMRFVPGAEVWARQVLDRLDRTMTPAGGRR